MSQTAPQGLHVKANMKMAQVEESVQIKGLVKE